MIREKALELYLYLRGGQITTEDGYYFADRFFNDPMFVDGWRV